MPILLHKGAEEIFHKHGFIFKTCIFCGSLYNSPRLTTQSIMAYHAYVDQRLRSYEMPKMQRQERIEILMKPRCHILNHT